MKVLMICAQFPPVYGGAGAQAALLAAEYARRGVTTEVVSLDQYGVGSAESRGYRVLRVLRGIGAKGLASRMLTTTALSLASAWRVLVWRPDVVHIHGVYWWSIAPALVGRLTRSTVTLKVTRDGQDDPATVLRKRLGPLPMGWLYGSSLRLANRVVVLSSTAFRAAQQAGLAGKTVQMRNGVDLARMARNPHRRTTSRHSAGLADQDRVALFVGFLVEHKGVADLLEAWRLLGDNTTQLWLVGPFAGFYRELDKDIPRQIEMLRAEGFSIGVLGHVPTDEMPALYWQADVFVLPSYAEGMPNSLMEAVVGGCQIVATSIPGVIDIVDSEQARLVAPGDVIALAHALKGALDGPVMDTSRAAAEMAIGTVVDGYLALYEGCAK